MGTQSVTGTKAAASSNNRRRQRGGVAPFSMSTDPIPSEADLTALPHSSRYAAESISAECTSQALRVLLVGPSLSILGGQAIQAERLLRQLRHDRRVVADFLAVNPELPRALRWMQRIKYVRTIVTSLAYWKHLMTMVPRFDVLHVLSASYWSFLLAPAPALAAAKLFRKKAILNYRSGEAADHLGRSSAARWLIRRFDQIVVPSGYLMDVFARFGLAATVIPNIVDFEQTRFRQRAPLLPRFLSNRNLEPLYNVGCTLRAYRLIADAYPEARLDIVGNGRERQKLEDLARELNLPNVTFHGQLPPTRMGEFYDAADIFLNSSDIDNMPTSLLEAQACGLPIASTEAGGIPYIVKHEETGLLVARNEPRALAAAAMRYLREPEFAARVIEAGRVAAEKYRWENVCVGWIHEYRRVAGRQ